MFHISGFRCLKVDSTAVIDPVTLAGTSSILVGPSIVKYPEPETLRYDDVGDPFEVVMFVYNFVVQFWIVHSPHSVSVEPLMCQGKI